LLKNYLKLSQIFRL